MSRIIITELAAQGLEHCRVFLAKENPHAAIRAAQAIKSSFELLETEPNMGRPLDDLPELRELIIPFGTSGYVALYRYDIETNFIYILALRHQREVGY